MKKRGNQSYVGDYFRSKKAHTELPPTISKVDNVGPKEREVVTQDYPGQKEQDDHELLCFDLNPLYGPCKGISRIERWNNASRFGLEPPERAREAIHRTGNMGSYLERFAL